MTTAGVGIGSFIIGVSAIGDQPAPQQQGGDAMQVNVVPWIAVCTGTLTPGVVSAPGAPLAGTILQAIMLSNGTDVTASFGGAVPADGFVFQSSALPSTAPVIILGLKSVPVTDPV